MSFSRERLVPFMSGLCIMLNIPLCTVEPLAIGHVCEKRPSLFKVLAITVTGHLGVKGHH